MLMPIEITIWACKDEAAVLAIKRDNKFVLFKFQERHAGSLLRECEKRQQVRYSERATREAGCNGNCDSVMRDTVNASY